MKLLKELSVTVDEIKKVIREILKNSLVLYKDMYDLDDSEIFDILRDDYNFEVTLTNYDNVIKIANELIDEEILLNVKQINNELPIFVDLLINDNEIDDNKCPILSQVWYGDMYDIDKVEAMKKLLSDLNYQLYKAEADIISGLIFQTLKRVEISKPIENTKEIKVTKKKSTSSKKSQKSAKSTKSTRSKRSEKSERDITNVDQVQME